MTKATFGALHPNRRGFMIGAGATMGVLAAPAILRA